MQKKRGTAIKIESGKPRENLRDGFSEGFTPLKPIDLSKVKSFSDMTSAMSFTALGAREVGEATDLLYEMATNKQCFTVLTVTGIMTVAKMGLIICDLIDRGVVHAVVSTGALITHGFVEGVGMQHFKYRLGEMDDKKLYYGGYDRIYDTLELESNLDNSEGIMKSVFDKIDISKPTCSYELLSILGKYLHENIKGRSIIKSAYENNVPIYIPAFTDSEMALDFSIFNKQQAVAGKKPVQFDSFLDFDHYSNLIAKQKELGIFTIGGGVPRNWAQQVGPYMNALSSRLGIKNAKFVRFKYGVRICPEPVNWGGLSGCTYSEGVSWGKFVPKDEGGKQVEVLSEATTVLPLMVKSLFERLDKKK